jgi:predicted amidohydrolase YtcJ
MTDAHDPQSISREEALKILTAGPAYAEFQERKNGVLAPGMLADVAVLSQDVMTATAAALPGTKSVLTVIGGKVAYQAQDTGNAGNEHQ